MLKIKGANKVYVYNVVRFSKEDYDFYEKFKARGLIVEDFNKFVMGAYFDKLNDIKARVEE